MSIYTKDVIELQNFLKICPPTREHFSESGIKFNSGAASLFNKASKRISMLRLYYGQGEDSYILLHFISPFTKFNSETVDQFIQSMVDYSKAQHIDGNIVWIGMDEFR